MRKKTKYIIAYMLTIFLLTGCGKDVSDADGQTVIMELPGYVEEEVSEPASEPEEIVTEEEYVPQGKITLVQETEQKRKDRDHKIINNIINAKTKGDEKTMNENLSILTEEDPDVAEAVWNTLVYWDETNTQGFANYTLDETLSQDDDLCFVVMGFALNSNGSMKDELIDRLNIALDAANKYPNAYILCTGGGTASGNRNATEAGKMAEWLKNNGVAEQRIIVEDKAQDTVDNAVNSYRKLANGYANVNSVVLISSDYHVPISCLLFEARFEMACAEGKDIHIISNVCCKKASSYNFSKDNQAKFLKEVYDAIL